MEFLGFIHKSQPFILLINVKMPTIVGILTFMSRINFMLSWVENEKSFITSGPWFLSDSVEKPKDRFSHDKAQIRPAHSKAGTCFFEERLMEDKKYHNHIKWLS